MSAVPTLCKIAARLCRPENEIEMAEWEYKPLHEEVAEWCYKAMYDMRVPLVRVVHSGYVRITRGTKHLYGGFGDVDSTYGEGDVLRLRNKMDFRPEYRPPRNFMIVTSMDGLTFYIDETHIAPYQPS